jgi:RNA-directed DNA polymerase
MSKNTVQESNVVENVKKSRSILDLTHKEACAFFLKSESYCSIDLPKYFNFKTVLANIDKLLKDKNLSDFYKEKDKPSNYDNVNYKILYNKDGRYSWRPLQLIHPALYVSLVHQITKEKSWTKICNRFKDFASNQKIKCISIPRESLTDNSDKAEQILNWLDKIEQKSIELAIEYECLTCTDITDCYGAIYTHSIPWALHDKDLAKKNKDDKDLIGNIIDKHLQDMSYGQTNGIPQGSALMDFIAEMLLGYADLSLTQTIEKEGISKYKILRYRDDYRIFTNNLREGEQILKCLTEVMIDLGLKLNNDKTKSTKDIVTGSIKSDKLYLIQQKPNKKNLQTYLLTIHELAKHYPNSGQQFQICLVG